MTTGFQVAFRGVCAQLREWRQQMSPNEYAALVHDLRAFLDAEQRGLERWLRKFR